MKLITCRRLSYILLLLAMLEIKANVTRSSKHRRSSSVKIIAMETGDGTNAGRRLPMVVVVAATTTTKAQGPLVVRLRAGRQGLRVILRREVSAQIRKGQAPAAPAHSAVNEEVQALATTQPTIARQGNTPLSWGYSSTALSGTDTVGALLVVLSPLGVVHSKSRKLENRPMSSLLHAVSLHH